MIIDKAQISLSAQSSYRETYQATEQLNFWLTPPSTPTPPPDNTAPAENSRWLEQVSISDPGKRLLFRGSKAINLNFSKQMDAKAELNLRILAAFYEAVTGKKLNFVDPSEYNPEVNQVAVDGEVTVPLQAQSNVVAQAVESAGYGLVYQRQERYQEHETLSVQTEGIIKTQDGLEIRFDASLTMQRSFVRESNLSLRLGDATKIDPLVINFDGKGAQLSQTRFRFDLDANGTEEQIASLRAGSGFLALDKNGDGQINNGGELFGPGSSSGFSALAKFDEDGNHFIDEGDSIYQKLRIWSFDEDGTQQLVGLGDRRIGAIFIGHLTSPFQLKDDQNKSLGEVANTGLYLREDGSSGWVQEINLTV